MKNLLHKVLRIPITNETFETETVQLWEVRWESMHGEIMKHTLPELECFTSEAQAEGYATALRNAVTLLRHDYRANDYNAKAGTTVTVRKAK